MCFGVEGADVSSRSAETAMARCPRVGGLKDESRTKSFSGGVDDGEAGAVEEDPECTVRRILNVEEDWAKACRMCRNSAGRARKGCRGEVMIGCLDGALGRMLEVMGGR